MEYSQKTTISAGGTHTFVFKPLELFRADDCVIRPKGVHIQSVKAKNIVQKEFPLLTVNPAQEIEVTVRNGWDFAVVCVLKLIGQGPRGE